MAAADAGAVCRQPPGGGPRGVPGRPPLSDRRARPRPARSSRSLNRRSSIRRAPVPARREIGCAGSGKRPLADKPSSTAGGVESAAQRRRRIVTVLRAHTVGALVDGADPEVIEGLRSRAEAVVRRAIERHGGIIGRADQDGVTAVFGLAVAREDDAMRVRAAAELRGEGAPGSAAQRVALAVGVATERSSSAPASDEGTLLTGAPLHLARTRGACCGSRGPARARHRAPRPRRHRYRAGVA